MGLTHLGIPAFTRVVGIAWVDSGRTFISSSFLVRFYRWVHSVLRNSYFFGWWVSIFMKPFASQLERVLEALTVHWQSLKAILSMSGQKRAPHFCSLKFQYLEVLSTILFHKHWRLSFVEGDWFKEVSDCLTSVSYTHLTLPTRSIKCRSRWSPYH